MVANAEVQPRKLDPDFAGLLQAKDVALAAQEALAQLKILSISRFAAVADTRAELRTFCESSLKPIAAAAVDVVGVASLVDAWECARVRIETRHKAEAEAVISGLPKTVARTELGQLREILESTFHEIPEKCAPAATTLERHFDMIDHGEWQQLSLQDYASREDAAQELVGATIDRSTGTIKVKQGHMQVPLPRNAEELRSRLRVVAHCFIMCSLRYPHLAVLKDICPAHFYDYADFLLGEQVLGLHARDAKGAVIASPPFDLVLAFDFQLRKHVMKELNAGVSLVVALQQATKDVNLRERFFTTPCLFHGSERIGHQHAARSRSRGRQAPRGGPRRKGNGKGKYVSRGQASEAELHSVTSDGTQICFRYNNPEECCRGPCQRAHVCRLCLEKHPMHACAKVSKKDRPAAALRE